MPPDAALRRTVLQVTDPCIRRWTGGARPAGAFRPFRLLPDPSPEPSPNPVLPPRPHRHSPGPLRQGREVATFTP